MFEIGEGCPAVKRLDREFNFNFAADQVEFNFNREFVPIRKTRVNRRLTRVFSDRGFFLRPLRPSLPDLPAFLYADALGHDVQGSYRIAVPSTG